MDINQLLTDLAVLAGILLMAVLAVGPLWLAHGAERSDTRWAAGPRTRGSDRSSRTADTIGA